MTCSRRGSRARAPEASSPRAAATRCACSCSPAGCPATSCALLTGTLVAESGGGDRARRGAARARAGDRRRAGARRRRRTTVLYVARRRARAHRRRAARPPLIRACAGSSRGSACGCAALRCAARATRATCCPWQLASRVLRFAALACFLAAFGLPATLAADPARRRSPSAAGGSCRSRPPRSARARRSSPPCFEPVTGTAVPAVAARRVLRRHEHGADRGRHRAGAGDLREERGSGLGERRAERRRAVGRLMRIRAAMMPRP